MPTTTERADKATDYFMEVTGTKSGKIEGNTTQKGREKQIALMGIDYSIKSPRDSASGQPTGKRQHHPVMVTAKMDRSGPKLFDALCTNENLKTVKIHCWSATSIAAATGRGGQEEVYTIELTDGSVAEFRHFTHEDGALCYEASFVFDKIVVTHLGGITATDNWLSAT